MKKLFLTFLLFFFSFSQKVYSANPLESCNDQNKCYGTITALPILISNILNVITILAAFSAFIMLIFGGFRYIIAQGDPKAVQSARATITWALVGLVMIIVSWLILLFISQFLGLNLTSFCFGIKAGGQPCY